MSSSIIVIRIRLLDQKVFRKFEADTNEKVGNLRKEVAEATDTTVDEYGLFRPKRAEEIGHWLRDDYPLDYYALTGIHGPDYPHSDYLEWRKIHRPIRVLQEGGTFTTVLADDTLKVSQLGKTIVPVVGHENAIPMEDLEEDDNVELLFPEMTLREQGYIGELTVGMFSRGMQLDDCGFYVQLPFWEGVVYRKAKGMLGSKVVKRWCVLRKYSLMVYKNREDNVEVVSLDLRDLEMVQRLKKKDASIPPKFRKTTLELILNDNNAIEYILCDSDEECKNWRDQIDASRRMFAKEAVFFGKTRSKPVDTRLKAGIAPERSTAAAGDGKAGGGAIPDAISISVDSRRANRLSMFIPVEPVKGGVDFSAIEAALGGPDVSDPEKKSRQRRKRSKR